MSNKLNKSDVKIDVYDGKVIIKCDNQDTLTDIIGNIVCTNLDKNIVTTRH